MEGLNVYEFSPYWHCYCEENVYRFLEKMAVEPPAAPEGSGPKSYDLYSAFVTSYSATPGNEVAPGEWQSAVPVVMGPKVSDIVYWDYHCVAVVKETTKPAPGAKGETTVKWWVVDYDTKLGKGEFVTPMPLELYFGVTLSAAGKNPVALLEARVRFVKAVEFLAKFRSDRRHMYLRPVIKDARYKQMPAAQLNNPVNFQHPPPKTPRMQGPSPVVAALKGGTSKAAAKEALLAHLASKEDNNKHLNNVAEFLNTQNTSVCKSDLVGIKEIGKWVKEH
eukprot:CAMPEP_0174850282 /NCGR_PEP_ID=MMETSP1114-20130205/19142_1 /TAXON_ID=312471 /ORGANISM="Neobodo designis, Strain CCAP 1951/1" /LENGTH=277 /DNA_ID=CAMNT_0016084729 /DNA_START=109 /DNA_END=942 /DNA_ORIENTATION=-